MYSVLNITKDYDANNSIMSSNIGHEENDFLESCKFASKYHFQGINLDLECPKYTVSEMQSFLQNYKLIPASFHLTVKLLGSEIEFYKSLEDFSRQAIMAEKLGCNVALKYLPPFSEKYNFDEQFHLYVKRLQILRPFLVKHNLKIAFEFIGPAETRLHAKYDFIHTIDGVRCLISAANLYHYAGFKLDIHHWQHSAASLLDLEHLDLEYILYVELNDGLPGYNYLTIPEFKRKLPLKTGVNNIKDFLKTLQKKGYSGPVAVEPWDLDITNLPIEEAIKLVKDSLDECFYLIQN